jgi:secreted trypsin-like serine protease
MQRWRGVALVLLLAGCGAQEDDEVGLAADAIVDGEVSAADEAVVGLVAQDQLYCTGTLVAGHVVLTAGHCLPPDLPVDPSEVKVFSGKSWADGGWIIDATDVWVHPDHLAGGEWSDVGLVALQHAPARPLSLRTVAPVQGESMRIVGFGRIDADANSDDVKRTGTATVASVRPDGMILAAAPSSSCGGDSGGPALANEGGVEKIAGVHSRGTCELDMTEMRADRFVSEVETFIQDHPPPTCDPDERCAIDCTSPDPDCPVLAPEEPAEEESGCAFVGGRQRDVCPWARCLLLAACAAVATRLRRL